MSTRHETRRSEAVSGYMCAKLEGEPTGARTVRPFPRAVNYYSFILGPRTISTAPAISKATATTGGTVVR
jgi:hypothetical protein